MSLDVATASSLSWSQFGDVLGETGYFVCATVDEVIKIQNYQRHYVRQHCHSQDNTPATCSSICSCAVGGATIGTILRIFLKIAVLCSTGIDLLLLTDILLLKYRIQYQENEWGAARRETQFTILLPCGILVKSINQYFKRLSLSCWIKNRLQKVLQ